MFCEIARKITIEQGQKESKREQGYLPASQRQQHGQQGDRGTSQEWLKGASKRLEWSNTNTVDTS
jgi:hypothetical protein